MNLKSVKVPSFGSVVPPVLFLFVNPGARDPDVVTHRDRKTVDQVNRVRVQVFPNFRKENGYGKKQVSYPVQATAEPARAQHIRDIAGRAEHCPGFFKVPAEKHHCDNGGCHYFRIRHAALRILIMVKPSEYVFGETVYCHNLIFHRFHDSYLLLKKVFLTGKRYDRIS